MKVKQTCLSTEYNVWVDEKINKYLDDGWIVKDMQITHNSGYMIVIFEKEIDE